MHILQVLIVSALLFIAACGGSGGGGGAASTPHATDRPPVSNAISSYEMLLLDVTGFLGERNYDNGFSGHITPPKNMPRSGIARYTGSAVLSVGRCTAENTPHLVGKTQLTADFAQQKIMGSVDKFSAAPNHSTKGGKLNFSGDIISGALSGKLAGQVGFDGKNHVIDGKLSGAFLNNADDIVLHSGGKTKSGDRFSAVITGSRGSDTK